MADATQKKTGLLATIKEIVGILIIVFIIRTVGFGLYLVPSCSMETTMLVGERFFADKLSYWFVKPQRGQIIAFNTPLFPYSENTIKRLFQEYIWGPSNWTKRVIAVPGDHLKGTIEDNKPVLYLNGVKLEEPYINKYPLLYVWKIDTAEVACLMNKKANSEQFDDILSPKSYDPTKPYDQQPFYAINPTRILSDDSGSMRMIMPGTALRPEKEVPALTDERTYWTGSDVFNVHLGPNEYWVMGDNRLGSKDSRYFGPLDGRLIHGKILWRIWSLDSDESWWIVELLKHPINFWKNVRWGRFFQSVK
jgi:signal peptidase I